MKILNLYAGIGGNRKLWDKPLKEKFGNDYQITAIEYNEEIAAIYKDFFPNDEVIITDAHQYLLEHFKEFDFIWSSPPCQSHTKMQLTFVYSNAKQNKDRQAKYPDMSLYQEIILLRHIYKGKYIIENVKPYYEPLIKPSFEIDRHLFWSNIRLRSIKTKGTGFIKYSFKELQKLHNIEISKYKLKTIDKEQVLRNCVSPDTGLNILNRALEIKESEKVQQGKLFV